MKKAFAVAVAALVSLFMASAAQAANEEVSATTKVESKSGKLYQAYPVPVDFTIRADVSAPPSETFITPMKNTRTTFPKGVSFNPDPKMPVCTDSKLSLSSDLNTPSTIVAACKDSVVGTGTSTIYLAGAKTGPIPDPILVIFNAGKSAKGDPKIKIYGYSKQTQVGILMHGELKNSVLDVAVPVLSYDSAVQYYQFDLPGDGLNRPEIDVNTRGLDPKYVRATCPTGTLVTKADFVLGKRNPSTGEPVGEERTVTSDPTTQSCVGDPGKAKLSGKAKGPKGKVKRGSKAAFKVTVSNKGTGIAKTVKVSGPGGSANAGNIAPGKSKTVTVRAKVTKPVVKFTIKGKGVSASTSAKVKLK